MDGYAATLPQDPPATTTLRIGELTGLLRRRYRLILVLALLGMAAAYAYARTLPKLYTASSVFMVEGDRFAIPELRGALQNDNAPDPMPWVRTEVQALTARATVTQVAEELELDKLPEFNPALRPPTVLEWLKQTVTALIMPLLPAGPADAPQPGPDEAVVAAASHALSVFQDNRSLVISVAFTAQDPRLASRFVNTLVADYMAARAKRRVDANQGANQALLDRIEQVRADLAAIETQMRDLRSSAELVAVRAGGVGQQQLEELTTAAARATVERSQLEASYERAATAAKQGSSDVLATVLASATVSRLRDQESAASGRMAQLSTHYGPDYPGVRSAAAELGSVRRQISDEAGRIVASLGAQLRVARAQETDVLAQLQTARKAAVISENSRAQLDQMQREATTRRALYQTLMERAQQTVAQPKGTETPDVRVFSPAVAPGEPSGPNAKLAALMGGGGGALLGCLFALIRTRARLDTAAELAAATGLPPLASLEPGTLRRGRGLLAPTPVTTGPDGTALRALRQRLRTGRRGAVRIALLLPAEPSDAAADATADLALALARIAATEDERVLLVDGEPQARRLTRLLALTPQGGARDGDWRDTVAPDRQPGLDLLPAAARDARRSAVAGPHFLNLLVEARAEYDLVVLAGPAASSPEAPILAQRADTAVLVSTPRCAATTMQAATSTLRAAASTPVSVVLAGAA